MDYCLANYSQRGPLHGLICSRSNVPLAPRPRAALRPSPPLASLAGPSLASLAGTLQPSLASPTRAQPLPALAGEQPGPLETLAEAPPPLTVVVYSTAGKQPGLINALNCTATLHVRSPTSSAYPLGFSSELSLRPSRRKCLLSCIGSRCSTSPAARTLRSRRGSSPGSQTGRVVHPVACPPLLLAAVHSSLAKI